MRRAFQVPIVSVCRVQLWWKLLDGLGLRFTSDEE